MGFTQEFTPLALGDLRREAAFLKADGWRFVQTHAVSTDEGIDLYYSFMKDGLLRNLHIEAVEPADEVPSITDMFLAAFVFENEARELFGVNMGPIAIDFGGAMYAPAVGDPMTIMTPEQKAARDKARKAAAAKAAKEAAAGAAQADADRQAPTACRNAAAPSRRPFVMTPELQARLDAKMPGLAPEKAAKVKAALEARAAEASQDAAVPESNEEARADARAAGEALACETPAQRRQDAAFAEQVEGSTLQDSQLPVDAGLESALASMDPGRADQVRSALRGAPAPSAADKGNPAGADQPPTELFADDEMEALLASMDPDRAARVVAALGQKDGE